MSSIRYAGRNTYIKESNGIGKRNFVIWSVILIFCISILIGFGSYAKGDTINQTSKCYKSIEIEPGDSISSICVEYCTNDFTNIDQFRTEVEVVNSLSDDCLIAGNYLIIPYYK